MQQFRAYSFVHGRSHEHLHYRGSVSIAPFLRISGMQRLSDSAMTCELHCLSFRLRSRGYLDACVWICLARRRQTLVVQKGYGCIGGPVEVGGCSFPVSRGCLAGVVILGTGHRWAGLGASRGRTPSPVMLFLGTAQRAIAATAIGPNLCLALHTRSGPSHRKSSSSSYVVPPDCRQNRLACLFTDTPRSGHSRRHPRMSSLSSGERPASGGGCWLWLALH